MEIVPTTAIIIISILSLVVLVLGFTTWNLLKKNEKAEDILVGYLEYLDKISRVIEASDAKVKKIDIKGSFATDDEIGFFFNEIKKLNSLLSDFTITK